MANTLKIKRGAAATIPQGQLAEPLFTTDTYDLYIGKGAGGNQRIQNYIASGTSSQFLKGDGSLDSTTYQATSEKGQNNGYASLDAGGKIPASQLPSSVIEYKGTWNASTNTPTLADGTGDAGDVYIVSVGGTQNLGSGSITFDAGDWVMYNGSVWQKSTGSNAVASVNGQTGIVVLDTDDISEPVSATNLWFTNARARTAISLTTTGSSGMATYDNMTGVLNVPNYSISGLGGVPTSRQLTINGTAYDLSADRSWSVGTVTSVGLTTGTSGTDVNVSGSPVTSSGSITLNIPTASATNRGALSSTDWSTFNAKEPALTKGNLTETTSSVLTITGGTGAVIGSGTTIAVAQASGSTSGYLSSTDWTTFNSKQAQLNGTGFVKASGTTISYDNTSYLPLSGGTLSGAGGQGTPVLTINGSSNDDYNFTQANLSASLTTGKSSILLIGKSLNSLNSGYIGFNFNASGNTGNYLSFGLYDLNHAMRLYGTGNVAIASGDSGSKLNVGGTILATSYVTATAFIPTGSTVPTNGMYLSAANTLSFSTNSTRAITISDGQKVGIGADPISAYRLYVNGDTNIAGTLSAGIGSFSSAINATEGNFTSQVTITTDVNIMRFGNLARWGFRRMGADNRYISFIRNANATASAVWTVDGDNGNVGIGTASPLSFANVLTLHMNGGSGGSFFTMAGSGTRYMTLVAESTQGKIETNTTIPLVFATNETERMRITSGGAVQATNNLTANSPSAGNTGEGIIAGTSFKIDAGGTGQKAKMYVVSKDLSDTYGSGLQIQFANQADDKGFGFNLNTSGGYETYVKDSGAAWQKAVTITQDRYFRLATKGIQFNGDTADANSLDDYEEGSWTPAFDGAGSPSYSTQFGRYTKIGNMVFCTIALRATNISGSSTISITGLPFSAADANDTGQRATYSPRLGGHINGISEGTGKFRVSGTSMTGVKGDTNTTFMTAAEFTSGSPQITGNFWYYV